MTPAEVALVTQLIALATQAAEAAIAVRRNHANNASATEQTNLDSAHANLQKVITIASGILAPAS